MGHELKHASNSFKGAVNYSPVNVIDPDNPMNRVLPKEELENRSFENSIRKEQGDEPRLQPTIINP